MERARQGCYPSDVLLTGGKALGRLAADGKPNMLTVDSLHLTQQGHDGMADVVWALLEPAMPEASGQGELSDGVDREGRRVPSTEFGLPIDGR